MKNIVIPDQGKLDKIKAQICAGGADKLHILADFDRTLTRSFVDGEEVPSVISVLRDGSYLTSEYAPQAHALFDKYHPIEIDPNVSSQEKGKAMEERWRTHFKLLIKCGLKKSDLERVLTSAKIRFRQGALGFLDYLHEKGIPLVMISSSGLGHEMISMILQREGRRYDNIHIVGNEFEWDNEGRAIGIKEPVIHEANKDETTVAGMPFYSEIEGRRNIVLLGDNIEDNGMITGFDYENLLRVGFLNKNVEENLPQYEKSFDVVITNDGDMSFVNELVHECVEGCEGHEANDEIKQK